MCRSRPGRTWLAAQDPAWRQGVSTVAIDMCPADRAAVREHLPDTTLVVDHFHIVQLANQMIAQVRRRAISQLRGRRVRAADPEYGIRRRLQRNREDLSEKQLADMWNRLIDLAGPGEQISPPGSPKRNCATCSHSARPLRDLRTAARVLPVVRRHHHPRTAPPRRHHRDLVAPDRGVPAHRSHQRRKRRHQPADQARSPQRLRLPQHRQATTPITLRNQPEGMETDGARLISKTHLTSTGTAGH
jgi:Transposase